MLKRYLQMYADIKEYNVKEIFREGAKQGLIDNIDAWFRYHDHAARNLTAHTYNEITAEETYRVAQQFAVDAQRYSDLDLVLIANQPIDLAILTLLKEDFAESDLPFKVDLVDWSRISQEFQEVIKQQYEIIH